MTKTGIVAAAALVACGAAAAAPDRVDPRVGAT